MNLYNFNHRSTSPVPSSTLSNVPPRARFSTYDTLRSGRRPDGTVNVGFTPQVTSNRSCNRSSDRSSNRSSNRSSIRSSDHRSSYRSSNRSSDHR